jgi:DNA mismatch repair protein MutS
MRADHAQPGAPALEPSVLQRPGSPGAPVTERAPAYFADLKLDRIVAAIAKGREAHAVAPLFHAPLRDLDDIVYRHEVFRDLADAGLRDHVASFCQAMRRLRDHARNEERTRNPLRRQRFRFDAAARYCACVTALARALETRSLTSRALRDVAAYVGEYVRSPAFTGLHGDVRRLEDQLAAVTYHLMVLEDRVHVRRMGEQHDYGAEIERTFQRFRRDGATARPQDDGDASDMSEVEAAILELVARLHPEVFAALAAFADTHASYVDPVVERFEREVRFYLAYLAYAERFEAVGLRFCLPEVTATDKRVRARQTFDLALADVLVEDGSVVVCNDVALDGDERILVVTGANQGGKSTFARTFGQLHYLAALGCPVPGTAARLFLFDRLLTHFEREEDLRTLQGKLNEELTRLHTLLDRVTPGSVVIMNEAFSSTATDDALALGRETLARLLAADALGVFVTFTEELASYDSRVASVVATVQPENPARRTYRLVRRAADGHAHALAIAEAYGLTYGALRRRLAP